MKVHEAEFIRSAASASGFPRDPVPQLALVGRSNVGKSSLINALVRQRIARTSAAAGKTRHVNIYRVCADVPHRRWLYLVDLPGYGYARGGETSTQEFEALTTAYFGCAPGHEQRTHGVPLGPTGAIHVVDARHPGLKADCSAWRWVSSRVPALVVASKIDKLTRAERERALKEWHASLSVPILPVSAVSGEGLNELWTAISNLLQEP